MHQTRSRSKQRSRLHSRTRLSALASLEASKLLRGGTVQIRSGDQARVERHVAPQRQLRAPSEVMQVEAALSRLEVQLDQMIANHLEPRRKDLGHVDPDDPARGSRSCLGSGEAAHAVHSCSGLRGKLDPVTGRPCFKSMRCSKLNLLGSK